MKPRFTPALCEYLEGQGFDILIQQSGDSTVRKDGKEVEVIQIVIPKIPEKDIPTYIKEMTKLAKMECTNG